MKRAPLLTFENTKHHTQILNIDAASEMSSEAKVTFSCKQCIGPPHHHALMWDEDMSNPHTVKPTVPVKICVPATAAFTSLFNHKSQVYPTDLTNLSSVSIHKCQCFAIDAIDPPSTVHRESVGTPPVQAIMGNQGEDDYVIVD
jgi:hypothetical protein